MIDSLNRLNKCQRGQNMKYTGRYFNRYGYRYFDKLLNIERIVCLIAIALKGYRSNYGNSGI